jgi:L-threonylcarbamoyladenylate synthase
LDEVTAVLHRDGVLAVPTESFYALAADPWRATAVERLYALKGRPDGKPILILIADRAHLAPLVREIPPAATVLMDRFWPGPLTIVLPASPDLPVALTAGTGTIGIRQPKSTLLQPLLRHVGPLTGTSANRSGEAPVTHAGDVELLFGDEVDLILDGGPTPGGRPSTVVRAGTTVDMIREGAVGAQEIHAALVRAGHVLNPVRR